MIRPIAENDLVIVVVRLGVEIHNDNIKTGCNSRLVGISQRAEGFFEEMSIWLEYLSSMLQSPDMLSRRREIIAALALCLAPLIFFLPATLGQIVLCPDDGVLINLPMRATVAQMIKDGVMPLWDPYIFGGMPLLGASQAGVFFPPNWLFLVFSSQAAINAEMILAYMVAGVGAFVYARRTGAAITGALITGFAFQFAGFIVAPTGHMGSIQAAGLLPWILWSIDGYGMTGRRSRAVVIAVLVALQLFAGHPQTFLYSILLGGAYALVMAFRKGGVNRAYLYSIGMIVAGIALGAVQLLPTLELTQQSYRQAIGYEFFSGYSLPPSSLLNFLTPYINGGADGRFFQLPYTGLPYYGEYVGYLGVITLLLAIAEPPLLKRDRLTVFWCATTLICLTLALGGFLPYEIYRAVQYVPGLKLVHALRSTSYGGGSCPGRAGRTRHDRDHQPGQYKNTKTDLHRNRRFDHNGASSWQRV